MLVLLLFLLLTGVTQAAKEYFDAIVKVGEAASDTKGSRQLGKV